MADGARKDTGSVFSLPTDDGHVLHVETYGQRTGTPFVFLHGGPGSGCQPSHRDLFDPIRDFVVFPDQRGAGRSTPVGTRVNNTTAHLVADLDRVRSHLGLESWTLVGGSWGATLALAYAAAHPQRVTRLILRATFLGTRAELDLAFDTGLQRLYPDLHADFLSLLTDGERSAPLDSYWARILHPDPAIHRPAAIAWHDVERVLSVAHPDVTRLDPERLRDASGLPRTPFMEAYYFRHDCFLAPNALVTALPAYRHIPATIVHGDSDHLCALPIVQALADQWPAAQLKVVTDAGHSLLEHAIFEAVRKAIASA